MIHTSDLDMFSKLYRIPPHLPGAGVPVCSTMSAVKERFIAMLEAVHTDEARSTLAFLESLPPDDIRITQAGFITNAPFAIGYWRAEVARKPPICPWPPPQPCITVYFCWNLLYMPLRAQVRVMRTWLTCMALLFSQVTQKNAAAEPVMPRGPAAQRGPIVHPGAVAQRGPVALQQVLQVHQVGRTMHGAQPPGLY